MNKLIFIFFLFFGYYSYSQTDQSDFYGSWFGSTGFGATFYKVKRNGVAVLYFSGCTNPREKKVGTWTVQGDSIELKFLQDTMTFRILNNQLTNTQIGEGCNNCGFNKTYRKTISGAKSKWKNEQRRRRRDRYKS